MGIGKTFRGKKYIFITLIIVLLIMVVIYCFSDQPGYESHLTSGSVVDKAIHFLYPEYDDYSLEKQGEIFDRFDLVVRKTAHFCEYAGLAFWVYLHILAIEGYKQNRIKFDWLFSVGISFLYACSDEFHQYYVPGRSGMFIDSLWDTVGAAFGVLVAVWIVSMVKRKAQ